MFARISTSDLIVYQALVDALAPDLEAHLPGRDVVFASRQGPPKADDPFEGTPGKPAFNERLRLIVQWGFEDRYAIVGDIAGYYASIDIDELERLLLEVSSRTAVVRDLGALLRAWQGLGVRGLPQGLQPSAPLGNLYLRPLDRTLASLSLPYVRFMDDFVVAADSFHHARSVLDALEAELYPVGLSLTAEKTKIRRYETTEQTAETAADRLARIKQGRHVDYADWLEEATAWTDYPPKDTEMRSPNQLDREAVLQVHSELAARVEEEDLPKQYESDVIATFRELATLKAAAPLATLPWFIERVPSATADVLGYAAEAAKRDPEDVASALEKIVSQWEYMRELERLQLCTAALRISTEALPKLAATFGRHALEDQHPLIRARALLVWGRLAARDDFEVADQFWKQATFAWQPYALTAIQQHNPEPRDSRYARWASGGGFLEAAALTLQAQPISWRKL